MENFKNWLEYSKKCKDSKKINSEKEEEKKEGVNPTDVDSAGMDQDLDNVGVPFDLDTAEKIASVDRERDEQERDYQKKIFDLMFKKQPKDDPSDIDPTAGPQGQTRGGTLDKTIKSYLVDKLNQENERRQKDREQREKVNVKTTSTLFRQDQKSTRNDTEVTGGNADKHSQNAEK